MRMGWAGWAAAVVGVGILVAGCGQQAAWKPPNIAAGDAVVGARIFKTTCSTCHGPTANGISPTLAPGLRGHAYLFQLYPTQSQLAAFIHYYMPKTDPGSLTKSQAADLAAFIYGINGKLGSGTEKHLLALLGAPPSTKKVTTPKGTQLAAEIAAGGKLFKTICATCHGPTGQGDANSLHAPGLWPPAATASAVKALGYSGLVSFIKTYMPFQTTDGVAPGSLTLQQATDAALFILSHK
jgi:cytochrome c